MTPLDLSTALGTLSGVAAIVGAILSRHQRAENDRLKLKLERAYTELEALRAEQIRFTKVEKIERTLDRIFDETPTIPIPTPNEAQNAGDGRSEPGLTHSETVEAIPSIVTTVGFGVMTDPNRVAAERELEEFLQNRQP